MYFIKAATVLFFIFCISLTSLAQPQNFTLKGVVKDSSDMMPVEMVVVSVLDLNYWTTTNNAGKFSITNVPSGVFSISFHCLGYKDVVVKYRSNMGSDALVVFMQQQSLGLKEVTVTATESKFGTSSTIKSEAIQHIQPKSLTDIFQLLPGQITENPNLASPGQIKIRDIASNSVTALGTMILLDGTPVTNDANMQVFSTARTGTSTATPGTLGAGVDLRDLSAENIESVEVIRGIPSSEYGNLTSGVVLVTTKAGETPWKAGLKADPNSKIASIAKGFRLKNNKGVMNAGIDYSKSYNDLRLKYKGYQRLTGNLGYSNTFFKDKKPLSVNYAFSYYQTLDKYKTDPQLKTGEIIKSDKQGFRTSLTGKWMLRTVWITNLEYALSGDYAVIDDYEKNALTISSGAVPYPTSYTNGEYAAGYLPGVFYSEYTMNGKPFNFSGKFKGDLVKQWGNIFNKALAGFEYSMSGNKGEGLTYDIAYPPSNVLSSMVRPRKFYHLPLLQNLSFFVEDKLKLPVKTTNLTLQQGLRLSVSAPGNIMAWEPRTIVSYELLNKQNNPIFESFAINLGYGITAKMPTLVHLSPDKAYFDEVSLNYLDGEGSLAVITTHVIDKTKNDNLKPALNNKKEIGIDFTIRNISAVFTFYHEYTNDCLDFLTVPYSNVFRKYTIEGAGKTPVYENGNVYYFENGEKIQASYVMDTTLRTYYIPSNDGVNLKKGLEYTINAGKINTIRTSFVFDGAWLYDKRYNTQPTYVKNYSLYQGKAYPYMAIMPAGDKTIRQRFNTNIRTITHVPELRMVFSVTTQIIWIDRTKYRWEDDDGTPYVYYYQDGVRIDGSQSAYNDMDIPRYVDPSVFIDKAGVVHPWKKEYSLDPRYSPMVSTNNSSYYYVEEKLPPVVQFNIRMTKEFANNLTVAFMVNNFLKMNPYQKSNKSDNYVLRNTSMYFGAEINYKF